MAWADAGYGLTLFERYPTDRIRGEFPNLKNSFTFGAILSIPGWFSLFGCSRF